MAPTAEQKQKLFDLAFKARDFSYSPYSKFRVGAALLTKDGTTFTGANIENASYGGAICAERTAIVKAVSEGHKKIIAIAVATDIKGEPLSPCGICRQYIREFGKEIEIYMVYHKDESNTAIDYKMMTLEELLPLSFGPESLEIPRQ